MSADGFAGAVIVPTFNNARTLAGVLDGLRGFGLPIIVVDDGGTDGTADVLEGWRARNPSASLRVERHEVNLGKGQALRTGFRACEDIGATHAVSIDSDGQHDPADVGRLLDVAREQPRALVVGVREARIAGCPGRCALGRRVANGLVWFETLERLRDTQCGLRVYPIELVRSIRCTAERFGYETEILVRAAWAGCEIVELPVSCVYEVPGGRVSHWRPVVDSMRDGLLHVRLATRSMVPRAHQRWPAEDEELSAARRQARRVMAWMSPRALWREMREVGGGDAAASLAVGAFVACSPFYGLHAWVSLYLAWRLRLHPLPAVVGSLLSTPPVGLVIVAASVQTGHVLLTGRLLGPGEVERMAWWAISARALGAWLLGSMVVGSVVGAGVYVISSRAARVWKRSVTVREGAR